MPSLANHLEMLVDEQAPYINSKDLLHLSAVNRNTAKLMRMSWQERFQKHFPEAHAALLETCAPHEVNWRREFSQKYALEIPDDFARRVICSFRDGDFASIPDVYAFWDTYSRKEMGDCFNSLTVADAAEYFYNSYVSHFDIANPEHHTRIYEAAMCFNQPLSSDQHRIFDLGIRILCSFKYDRSEILRQIIESQHININASRLNNECYLISAINLNSAAIFQMLLDMGAVLNVYTSFNDSALSYAIGTGRIAMFYSLVEHGASLDVLDQDWNSLLHIAAAYNQIEICEMLIANGADIERPNIHGYCALRLAIHFNHMEICQLLLNHGANLNLVNSSGFSSFHYALQNNHVEICEMLIAHGADLEKPDTYNNPPLHYAIQFNYIELCRILLNNGANPNKNLALHFAIRENRVEICEMLIAHGANLELCTSDGLFPLDFAIVNNSIEACQLLLNHGVNPNLVDSSGSSSLHFAIKKNRVEICEVLIAHGADIDMPDGHGNSPLAIAIKCSSYDVLRLLNMKLYEQKLITGAEDLPIFHFQDDEISDYILQQPLDLNAALMHVLNANRFTRNYYLLRKLLSGDPLVADPDARQVAEHIHANPELMHLGWIVCGYIEAKLQQIAATADIDAGVATTPERRFNFGRIFASGATREQKIEAGMAVLRVMVQLEDFDSLRGYMPIIRRMDHGRIYRQLNIVHAQGLLELVPPAPTNGI